eukprot:COSAG02_NODE_50867_length_317_cov_7.444954_1_plen_44_part_10
MLFNETYVFIGDGARGGGGGGGGGASAPQRWTFNARGRRRSATR